MDKNTPAQPSKDPAREPAPKPQPPPELPESLCGHICPYLDDPFPPCHGCTACGEG